MRFTISLLLLLVGYSVLAQQFDTTVYINEWTGYTTYQGMSEMDFTFKSEDSTMHAPHRINPRKQNDIAWLDQGFMFSPGLNLENLAPKTGHFTQTNSLFENSFMTSESILFHHSKIPRTYFKYAQGTGDLIYLLAQHSQNIFDRWSVGVNYQRIKSQNLYYDNLPDFNLQRMTNAHGAQLYTHYVTRNRNYEVLADYTWNKNRVQETGGISDIGRFDTLVGRERLYAKSAFLSNALNQWAQRGFHVEQYFRPGQRTMLFNDSTVVDTTYDKIKSQWFHSLDITTVENLFTDTEPNLLLYPYRYRSLTTHDSVFNRVIYNRFGRTGRVSLGNIDYRTSILLEQIRMNQLDNFVGNYSNLQWHTALSKSITTTVDIKYQSEFALMGYYKGDWNHKIDILGLFADSSWVYNAGFQSIRHRPNYNMQFFGSNYHYWHVPMGKTDYQIVSAGLKQTSENFGIDLTSKTISGFAFINELGTPEQLNNSFNVLSVNVHGILSLGRIFRTNQTVLYQKSGSDKLRVPDLAYKTSFYAEGKLFHKNMLAQLGVDGYYYSRFKGYRYDPASRMFALSDVLSGGYPMLDIFLNMHVRTMQLFVTYEHVTQGFFDNDSYSLNGYPLMSRSVRFGVDWRLFN